MIPLKNRKKKELTQNLNSRCIRFLKSANPNVTGDYKILSVLTAKVTKKGTWAQLLNLG